MSRRIAFLWGSNANKHYPTLRYAKRDVNRLQDALSSSRYGFAIVTPPDGSNPHQIHEAILETMSACAPDDVFIGYFTGHGQLIGSKLYFVLDNSVPGEIKTLFSSAWLLDAFQSCQARNRLLILDCCYAGAATGIKGGSIDVTILFPEHRDEPVLYASGKLETAREFKELEGSFLTHVLCKSLTSAPAGHVALSQVVEALQRAAAARNKAASLEDRVPVPYLSKLPHDDFYFSTSSDASISQPRQIPDSSRSPVSKRRSDTFEHTISALHNGLRAAASDGQGAYFVAMLVFGLASVLFHHLKLTGQIENNRTVNPNLVLLSFCAMSFILGVSILVLSYQRKLRRQQSLLSRGLPYGLLELCDGKIIGANDRAEEILRVRLPRLGIHSAQVEFGKTFAPMIDDLCVLLPSHGGPPSQAAICSYDGKIRDRAADGLMSVFYAWVTRAQMWIKVTSTVILLPSGAEHVVCVLDTAVDQQHVELLAKARSRSTTEEME